MKSARKLHRLIVAGLLLALATAAPAQALFIARKAIGRIEQMTQSQSSPANAAGDAAHSVATVIVDVAAERVFAAVKREIEQNGRFQITRVDDAKRSLEFGDGTQLGTLQVSELGDQLSQLLVSTLHPGSATTAPAIATHIIDVCRQLAVSCQVAAP